jgi:hypothetical protein
VHTSTHTHKTHTDAVIIRDVRLCSIHIHIHKYIHTSTHTHTQTDAMVTRDVRFLFGERYWGGSVTIINGVEETNDQVKTGLFGLRPSKEAYKRLIDGLQRDDIDFTNNEQGYVTKVFAKEWGAVPSYRRMPRVRGVCMYVCMYVCIYVCTPVCMYALLYVCMYVCMYSCMYALLYACMYVLLYVCMYVCVYVYMHECMYSCIYVCMYSCMYIYIYIYAHTHRWSICAQGHAHCAGSTLHCGEIKLNAPVL